ncbi:hypothetical protein BSKO_05416 [Bryopsis sp. KO-2023]|nr:hypothetical protein BSKO_05416 [Bryopsis sp. KO-2023]
MGAVSGLDDDDELLFEMDVHLGSTSLVDVQLYLMQYPLRPAWRPYSTDEAEQIRFKPKANRLEMDIPLDTTSNQYDEHCCEKHRIKKFTLKSSEVTQSTAYAIGLVRNGALYLSRVDSMFHMRPSISHVDSREDEEDREPVEEKKGGGLKQLNVKVQKKETEAQVKRRLTSYAHMLKQENDEAWKLLTPHASSAPITSHICDQMTQATPNDIKMTLDKAEYLEAFAPAIRSQNLPTGQDGGFKLEDGAEKIDPKVLAKLPKVLAQLFKENPVANLGNIRAWLATVPSAQPVAAAGRASDATLHNAIVASGAFQRVKGVYLQVSLGDDQIDPFRTVLIELLANPAKDIFKKTEIKEAAKAKGVSITEALFMKVMKTLCDSKPGGFWQIKMSC